MKGIIHKADAVHLVQWFWIGFENIDKLFLQLFRVVSSMKAGLVIIEFDGFTAWHVNCYRFSSFQ